MSLDFQQWISQLNHKMPIVALSESTFATHAKSLRLVLGNSHPFITHEHEAMLWLRIGLIDPAHELVQSATDGTSAYIHGIVHRLEGDYWNANYWFRRVGNPSLLHAIETMVVRKGNTDSFDPGDFTSQVESWNKSKDPASLDRLEQIATQEWQSVWDLL